MLLSRCPHCDTNHVHAGEMWQHQFSPNTPDLIWHIVRCQNPSCQKNILVILEKGQEQGYYPAGSFELSQDIRISQEIRGDFKEAGLSLSAGCYRASMVMSRRVLQRCLKEQGCAQRKLVDAIDNAVKEGILRRSFHALATEIREYGNLGAHPDDEQLIKADAVKAKQILDFARLLIHEFYEVPAQADALRQARENSKLS